MLKSFKAVPRSMAGLAERLSGIMPTPSARGRKGWCGCLKNEPPVIEYLAVGNSGTLQMMTPTLPMPEKPELDRLFDELVEELDLTAVNKAAMMELPAEKKWQIYCSKKKGSEDQENAADLSHSPESYIERMQMPNGDKTEKSKLFDSLKTALRTQPHSFVLRFVKADGLIALLKVLSEMDYETKQGAIHTSIIGCVKALMNNSTGREHVLAHPSAISTIARSLLTENPRTKVAVLEILGASCLVVGGHKKVLDAMTEYKEFVHERARFQGIINDLDRNTGELDDLTVKTAIMSFINAVLSYGPGQESLEFRLHLRYELLQLGLKNIINKLRQHEDQTLDKHMDFFEMVRCDDEKELARKFEQEQVDTQSATSMFDLLRRKLSHSPAYPHFLSLLQHFLLLPLDYGSLPQHWLLFDRIVQQITLQTDAGVDNDVMPININVKEIVQLLVKEEEFTTAKNKAEELEKENSSIAASLAKKEQELDLRNQEKEDMEASISRVKERLEKEISIHSETKQKVSELEDTTSELQHRIAYEQAERRKLEAMLSNGSVPDDAKVNFTASIPIPPPPPPMSKGRGPAPPPAPPLQASQSNLPPPPGLPQMVSRQRSVEIPKPSAPLKSFNWAKLPETKVAGTVWADIDEGKVYSTIDLETIDKLFCAYQNQNQKPATVVHVTDGSSEDLRQTGKNKSKIVSVIDGRRAQNCTILLSKLKMSDDEIARMIFDMDSKDVLPLDMVEQLLKFTPGPDEAALLEEHSYDLDSLARADRFLYEISKIAHYEQRLNSLVYKKKFTTWTSEVEGRAKLVMEASREVARSRRLRKLLELVLALGNYMNKGARGNAWGFRLSSLNKLKDTKSSTVRGTTLLHYIADMADKKEFKDILLLEEDLPHVKGASKVCLAELEKDMLQLRNNLKEVEREVEFQRVQPVAPNDMFVPVMKEFLTTATSKFSELEDLFQDMKTRFDRAVRLFGEDNSTIQPDNFFGTFDSLLTALCEAHQDNINAKKKRIEEEKRMRQEVDLKKLTIDRKNCKDGTLANGTVGRRLTNHVSINGNSEGKAEFDDLISALQTGDVFGEDSMAKIKRSRKSRHSPPAREHSRDRVLNVTRQK